ncbi:MAG: hypothetical protein HQ527_07830 [Cyanobacteria bacterium]|nr:hypothetical protein [Cyanobacteria bacterium bin.51]
MTSTASANRSSAPPAQQPSANATSWVLLALVVLHLAPAVGHQRRISRWLASRPEKPIVFPWEVRQVLEDLEREFSAG